MKRLLQQVHPTEPMIHKWRREADACGRFPEIGTQSPQMLDAAVASVVRDLDVQTMRVIDLKELGKLLGVSQAGRSAELKTRFGNLIQEIRQTGTAVISRGRAPIPWVFSKEKVELFDSRCRRLVVPDGMLAFCSTHKGILEDSSSCWRMTSRMQVFKLLPVLFLDTIPALHSALSKLVYAIQLLTGRVITERTRRDRGFKTCFHHVGPADVNKSKLLMPESLSEYAKLTSTDTQKSHLHHFCHYPRSVGIFGHLEGYTMLGDERRNKVSFIYHTHHARYHAHTLTTVHTTAHR